MLQALPAAVFTTDQAGRITFFNEAAAALWGCRPALGTDPRSGAWRLLSPEGEALTRDAYPTTMALREERPLGGVEAVVERPDGTRVPFLAYPTPLRDGAGRLTGSITMLVDISERKRAEVHQKTLLDELNHRVKNTLATVQSLAGQTIRKTGLSPDLRADFEGRLIALSRAHDQLTRERWGAADLKTIIDASFEPFRRSAEDTLKVSGEKIKVGAQAALTLSMIFHELATNAAKYGALSSPNGRLDVSWKVTNGARPATLCINWCESGGPAVQRPLQTGFGSRLLERGVAYQLKGSAKLDYDPAGLRCTMEIPLASMPG
jgi:PAS domain S-box-containing protein